jgi:hypothetical protein
MRKLIQWLQKIDMNVFLIAHEKATWGDNPSTGLKEEIGKEADVWFTTSHDLGLTLRVVSRGKTFPSSAIVVKTRLEGFPKGEMFPLDYPEFARRYGKTYIESVVKPFVQASSESINEINRLTTLLNISQEEISKILNKAEADSWSELSDEQATKTIAFFTNKITGKAA